MNNFNRVIVLLLVLALPSPVANSIGTAVSAGGDGISSLQMFTSQALASVSAEAPMLSGSPRRRMAALVARERRRISVANLMPRFDEYLRLMGNRTGDIQKAVQLLARQRFSRRLSLLVELGAGRAQIAFELAMRHPNLLVLAADVYDPSYELISSDWDNRKFLAHDFPLKNLAVLRAGVDILHYLPDESLKTLLLINPEGTVASSVTQLISDGIIQRKLQPKPQVVVKPFERLGIWMRKYFPEDWVLEKRNSHYLGVDLDKTSDFPSSLYKTVSQETYIWTRPSTTIPASDEKSAAGAA